MMLKKKKKHRSPQQPTTLLSQRTAGSPIADINLQMMVILLLMAIGVVGGGNTGNGAVGGGGLVAGVSPEAQGLRPSGEVPPPDLLESSDLAHDPQPKDINATFLTHKLAQDLDPHYMSVTPPTSAENGRRQDSLSPQLPFRRNRKGRLVPVGVMPQHLKELDLKWVRLGDGSKVRTRVPNRLKRKLQQLLWAVTACPLGHRWKDLGPRFWPRWLREGHCPGPTASCSIPPGMKCRPSATAHRTLLRWHCKDHCTWIKVQYPVVTECSCACTNNSFNS